MTIHSALDADAAVLATLDAIIATHRARDAAALTRLYAPDARLADLAPPLLRRGFDAAAVQAWLDGWDGPVELEFRDIAVASSGGLALVDGLVRTAARRNGAIRAWWARFTGALTRGPEGWRIAHEHVSVPFHMEPGARAALDLLPDDPIQQKERPMPNDALTETRPAADTMRGVIPYLDLNGRAAEAAEFYARAFGAKDLGRMEDPQNPGRHMHVQVAINGGALMMTDGMSTEARPGPQGLHLQLVVADGAAWWERAIDAGCTVEMPYEKQFWGDTWGLMRDPFGVAWAVLEDGAEG